MLKPIIPDGEALRYAFEWLAEQGHCTLKTVEQASLRFDLTPRDEEFLLRQFVYHRGAASDAPDSIRLPPGRGQRCPGFRATAGFQLAAGRS